MNTTKLISQWIEEQVSNGVDDDVIAKVAFSDGTTLHTLKKTRKKGQFNLNTQFNGLITIEELNGKFREKGE